MSRPISPPPVRGAADGQLPAYIANGVLGLRVRDVPLRRGVIIVNGLEGEDPVTHVISAAEAPYPLAGDLQVGRTWLSDALHRVDGLEQALDIATGELTSRFRFATDDGVATVEVLTYCSRSEPTIVAQELSINLDRPCDVSVRVGFDASGVPGAWARRETETPGTAERPVDGSLLWRTLGDRSTLGEAYITEFMGDAEARRAVHDWGEQRPMLTQYTFRARTDRRYRLRQLASVVAEALHRQPDRQAVRLVARASHIGWDTLRAENRRVWEDLWRGRVLIRSTDDRWQRLADLAFFYLNASVHRSSPSSTSIFGLAEWPDYHYYYGHVMWDVDTFVVPTLLFSQPDAAHALLSYRSRGIEAARRNAQMLGYGGIQFPWESGLGTSDEASPLAGDASRFEDHVSVDVALAFARYVHVTGDDGFLREEAWPVLQGVSDWLATRLERTRRGWEWRRSMGVAERPEPSDNPVFATAGAKVVLGEAIGAAERLGRQVSPTWLDMRDRLLIPCDPRTGVLLNHDGYRRDEEKGETPDPAAVLFPMGYLVEPAAERATLEACLSRADEYIGSPMLSALFGTWAAWTGDRGRSRRLLEEGYAAFETGRFGQILEYRADRFPEQTPAGPFAANMGGFLLGCMWGLPGILPGHDEPARWPRRRVVLPEGWEAIEIERAWVRGQAARIEARHGAQRATIELESGD
jgi:trehalose/maltose hydrolase-like predicted phosphorylase